MDDTQARPPSLLVRLPKVLRRAMVFTLHFVLFSIAFLCAVALRFDFFTVRPSEVRVLLHFLPTVLVLKGAVFYLVGHHRGWWRYAGLHDLVLLAKGTLLSSALVYAVVTLEHMAFGASRSVLLLDLALTFLLLGGARLA